MTPVLKTRGLDLSRINLCDALDLAVLVEEEARDRYAEFADQLTLHHTPEAAGFFRWMSGIEERHRLELSERRRERFGTSPARVHLGMIFDVEAPEYDQARAFMSVREALHVALRSEQSAQAFFAAAKEAVTDPETRALFAELEAEEVLHQRLVRQQIEAAPPDPPGDPDDYSDPPVEQ
ncbi:MAG: ferritin family protein [Planctomycetes bacterium]|nr:ferritin family protein [Planctomycetota bacterium]